MEMEKIKGKAKTSASWARLIHKIFSGSSLVSQLWQSNEKHRFYYQSSRSQKNFKTYRRRNRKGSSSPCYHAL